MSSCRSHRKFKRRHLSREAAQHHAEVRQATTNIKVDIYKCPDCRYWHVGRHKTTKAEKFFTSTYKERYEEVLVGKLIAALKPILNKEKK